MRHHLLEDFITLGLFSANKWKTYLKPVKFKIVKSLLNEYDLGKES